jgi:5-carboxyvanillate decarboxylase
MMTYRRIALEENFVTKEVCDEWGKVLSYKNIEPGFRAIGVAQKNLLAGEFNAKLVDLGAGRIAQMDQTGIDVQVIFLNSPGVQVFDAVTATELAAQSNDRLADAVKAHPTRFVGLAAIAPQYPKGAAREIERAVKLGLSGLAINSHTNGEYLDDPKYWDIFEAAEALDVPIYLHPREPGPALAQPYLDYGLFFSSWGFAAETGLHSMRLIMGGVFDRFPKLRIILGHMGEAIPYWIKRIDNRHKLASRIGMAPKLARLPGEYFLDHFVITTSGMMDPLVLTLCMAQVGVDRILFAADYPHESVEDSVAFMDAAPISEADKVKIYSGNAEKLFKMKCLAAVS